MMILHGGYRGAVAGSPELLQFASVWSEALLGPLGVVFEVVRGILGTRSNLSSASLVPFRPLLIESLVMGERHTDIDAWTRRVEVKRRILINSISQSIHCLTGQKNITRLLIALTG